MAGASGRIRPESQFTNAGRNAIGTNDKIVSAVGSVAEADPNTIMILPQRDDRRAQPAWHCGRADQQSLLKFGTFYSDERPDAIPKILEVDLEKPFTLLIAKTPAVQDDSAVSDGAIESERPQGAHCVRLNGHSSAQCLPGRIALDQIDLEAPRVQRRG